MYRFAIIAGIKGKPTTSCSPLVIFPILLFCTISISIPCVFNISIQTLSLSFILAHFSCMLTPSNSAPLSDHPDSRPCVLQLFPCCGSSLCYFVSAWLRLSQLPPRDPSNPISFSLCPVLPNVPFPLSAHALKNRRGMAFVFRAGVPGG